MTKKFMRRAAVVVHRGMFTSNARKVLLRPILKNGTIRTAINNCTRNQSVWLFTSTFVFHLYIVSNLTLSSIDYQSPPSDLPTHAMSALFVARARLHVVGSSCRFAGVLPAPKSHSERPGVDRRHRSCHEYRLMRNVARLLIGAE